MNVIFKMLLTINATSWMLLIYAVKAEWTFASIPYLVVYSGGVFLLILLSLLALFLSRLLGKESLERCAEFSLADNEFLPIYLGYFFVSLSVPNHYTLVAVYVLVFIFTYLSQAQYFNPIYLLFGYHYYNILTPEGTRIFVIKRGRVIRSSKNIKFSNLRRINDSTFLEIR